MHLLLIANPYYIYSCDTAQIQSIYNTKEKAHTQGREKLISVKTNGQMEKLLKKVEHMGDDERKRLRAMLRENTK